MKSAANQGVALIEVLVALAVVGGALVLLLSAMTATQRQSARDEESMSCELAAESKLSELLARLESASSGHLGVDNGLRWVAIEASEGQTETPDVKKLVLSLLRKDGSIIRHWTILRRVRKEGS